MCIIAAKPAGVPMPGAETLRTMWDHNDDGAGLMYVEKGKVRIEKGFMKYKSFEKALGRLGDRLDLTATPLVLHFRIRTHGGTNPECTHPFPITDSVGALKKLQISTDVGVAHNGIIHSVTPRPGISDTMEYIATQLAPLKRAMPKFYENKDARLLIQNAIGSRMVFLTKMGRLYTIGDFHEDGGVLYSNESYKPYNFRQSSWSCYYPDGFTTDPCGQDWTEEDAIPLCWLPMGGYVEADGEMYEGDCFLVDADGAVWEYDFDLDRALPRPGYTARTAAGTPVRYTEDEAEYMPVWA